MSLSPSPIVILFGRSGCGKGTQAKMLINEFGFSYLSSGDILRERQEKKDFTGKKLEEVLQKGLRVPTFLMFINWGKKIGSMKKDIDQKGIVIDGSPRSLIEAELMDELFNWYCWSDRVKVVLLDLSREESFARLTKRRICQDCGRLIPWVGEFKEIDKCDKCGGQLIVRADDQPEAINERLDYFEKDVMPVIGYYKKQGRLIRVNGDQPIEDVYQEIKSRLF